MLFCKESNLKSIEIIYSIVYLLSTAIRFVIMIPYRKSILHGGRGRTFVKYPNMDHRHLDLVLRFIRKHDISSPMIDFSQVIR
jgi:hypothetical protein